MAEGNREAQFAAMQAADQKKRDDLAWLKEQKGRRLVDGQRMESEAPVAEKAPERPAEIQAVRENPRVRQERQAREQKFNTWIKESRDTLNQWAKEYMKVKAGGFLGRDGKPDHGTFDASFIDRVQEQLAELDPPAPLTGRESQAELITRAAVQRANELVAAARVLDGVQKTIEDNVAKWKREGLDVISDNLDWKKVA